MFRKILVPLIFLFIGTNSYAAVLSDILISKVVDAPLGSFSATLTIPQNESVRIFLPNTELIQTSNIEITMPGGVIVNESNASAYNISFNLITSSDPYARLLMTSDGWLIVIPNAPAGMYAISGNISGTNNVPITANIAGSGIKFHVTVGEGYKNLRTNDWLPFSVYLDENGSALLGAEVHYNIYHNDSLVMQHVAKDDGGTYDVIPNDGFYNSFFLPITEGTYKAEISILGTNVNSEPFEAEIKTAFNVETQLFSISDDYVEETPDHNGDGYADELILTMPLTTALPASGTVNTYARIKLGDKGFLNDYRTIDVSENRIYVKFDGHAIRKLGYSGVINVEKFQYKYNGKFIESFVNLKDTSYYDISTWERNNLEYTNVFNNIVLDPNSDNFYDGVRVSFDVDSSLDATSLGRYGYTIKAYNQDGSLFKEYSDTNIDLAIGINTINLDIPASDIISSGGNVKLSFRELFVFPKFNADALLRIRDLGTTQEYNCWDFIGCDGDNAHPVAVLDSASVDNDLDLYIDVTANDTDADGDIVKLDSITQPTNGVVSLFGNQVYYVPNNGYVGTDTFTYNIVDVYPGNNALKNGQATGTVVIDVLPPNNPPVANSDSFLVTTGTTEILDVLSNDADPDGDTLAINEFTQPANGVVVQNGAYLQYTPNSGFTGSDYFNYTIFDGRSGYSSNIVNLSVAAINNFPVANDDNASTASGIPVTVDALANDTDADGDSLVIVSVTSPLNGQAIIETNTIRYTSNPGFTGSDSFTYSVFDGRDTATASIFINITADITPIVDITSHLEGSPIDTNTVTIYGTVADPDAGVTVNGVVASVVNNSGLGEFTANITVNENDPSPVITVIASGPTGLVDTASITLNRVDHIIIAGQSADGIQNLVLSNTRKSSSLDTVANFPPSISYTELGIDSTSIADTWVVSYRIGTDSVSPLGRHDLQVTYNILDKRGIVLDTYNREVSVYIVENDLVPPEISTYFPVENDTVRSYRTPITVQITGDSSASVDINGIAASQITTDQTLYTSDVNLVSGLNTITVNAIGSNGETSSYNYALTLVPAAPPNVVITSHLNGEDLATQVIDLVADFDDQSAVLSLSVNGVNIGVPVVNGLIATWPNVTLQNGSNNLAIYERYYSDPVREINLNYAPAGIAPTAVISQLFDNPYGNLIWETQDVRLIAWDSYDTDGSIVSYAWNQLSGTPVTMSSTSSDSLHLVMPNVDVDENVVIELTVTDNDGLSGTTTYTLINGAMRVPVTTVPVLFIWDPTAKTHEWRIDFAREGMPGTTYFRLLGKGRIVSNSSDCNYNNSSDWQSQCDSINDTIIFKISENESFSIEFYSVSAEGHTEAVQTRVLQ